MIAFLCRLYTIVNYNGATHLKPILHLATLFARCEAKTRIQQRDWLKLAGKKSGNCSTFLSVRANKFAKWKIGLGRDLFSLV